MQNAEWVYSVVDVGWVHHCEDGDKGVVIDLKADAAACPHCHAKPPREQEAVR